jgi:NADPH:quinone reductase-like Zn-dependent oxidoreductase
MGTMGELLDVLKLFDRGLLRPVVDRVFPMEEARAAHEYLEAKNQFGKVVLVP